MRPLLLCDALLFFAFGVGYASFAEHLSLWFGGSTMPASLVDLAATGGGLEIGLSAFLLCRCLQRGASAAEGLALVALVTGATALVRVWSMARFGVWTTPNQIFLGIELVGCSANGALYWACRVAPEPRSLARD